MCDLGLPCGKPTCEWAPRGANVSRGGFAVISESETRWDNDGKCAGISHFTAQEYEEDGVTRRKAYSVEVHTTFNHETKTWEAKVVRQWEGRF